MDNSNIRIFIEDKARFIRRTFVVSNAIQTIDNETAYLIIYCLNCIRHGGNSTYETGLTYHYYNTVKSNILCKIKNNANS